MFERKLYIRGNPISVFTRPVSFFTPLISISTPLMSAFKPVDVLTGSLIVVRDSFNGCFDTWIC